MGEEVVTKLQSCVLFILNTGKAEKRPEIIYTENGKGWTTYLSVDGCSTAAGQRNPSGVSRYQLKVDKLSFKDGPVGSKWVHMKLSPHQKSSVAAGLIDTKYRGAAKYLFNEDVDTNQAVRVIRIRILGKKEMLVLENEAEQSTDQATHQVSAIKCGAEAFIIFQRHLQNDETKENIEEQMDLDLELLVNAVRDQTVPDLPSDLRGMFYGDLHDPRHCTLSQACNLVREMLRSLESNPGLEVPLTVWLRPIDKSYHYQVRDIDNAVVDGCQQFLNSFSEVEIRAKTFLKKEHQLNSFPCLRNSLRFFVDYLHQFSELFRSELHRIVPAIRSGEKDEQALVKLLDNVAEGQFNPTKLIHWLSRMQNHFETLQAVVTTARQKQIPLIRSQEQLDNVRLDTQTKWVVALVLPSADPDIFLSSMKNYVENNRRIVRIHHDSSTEEENDSAADATQQELIKLARQMFQQAERRDEKVGFIITSLLASPSPYRPALALYENGLLVSNDFRLPSRPQNIRLKPPSSNSTSSFLEWDCDRIEDVIHFTVQYKLPQEKEWSVGTTAGPISSIELKSFASCHSSGYQVRIAAVSLIGVGEFSPVFHVQPALTSSRDTVPCYSDGHKNARG